MCLQIYKNIFVNRHINIDAHKKNIFGIIGSTYYLTGTLDYHMQVTKFYKQNDSKKRKEKKKIIYTFLYLRIPSQLSTFPPTLKPHCC